MMELKGSKVLLVEDRAELRDVFTTLLTEEGAVVTAAPTGRRALECASRDTFDIVLTDLGLPDIPGDLVIKEIAALDRPRPRIVALTGYCEPYLSRARAAGADKVLMKPVEWKTLLHELHPEAASAA